MAWKNSFLNSYALRNYQIYIFVGTCDQVGLVKADATSFGERRGIVTRRGY